jgi:hypothetical protein
MQVSQTKSATGTKGAQVVCADLLKVTNSDPLAMFASEPHAFVHLGANRRIDGRFVTFAR